MGGGIDVGVALVVLKRDRAVRDAEFEGAEGAVIVLPAAVIVIEVVPDELLDRGFEAGFGDGRVGVLRGELYFAEGWQWIFSLAASHASDNIAGASLTRRRVNLHLSIVKTGAGYPAGLSSPYSGRSRKNAVF